MYKLTPYTVQTAVIVWYFLSVFRSVYLHLLRATIAFLELLHLSARSETLHPTPDQIRGMFFFYRDGIFFFFAKTSSSFYYVTEFNFLTNWNMWRAKCKRFPPPLLPDFGTEARAHIVDSWNILMYCERWMVFLVWTMHNLPLHIVNHILE